MFGILMSAFNSSLGWIFKTVVIKFVIFSALFAIVTAFVSYIASSNILPSLTNIQSSSSAIPSSVAYMFSIFQVYYGISVIVSAYITRFMIRRIPLIG